MHTWSWDNVDVRYANQASIGFLDIIYGITEGVDNRFGWTAGGGVEWAFAEVWSARLEYDYYGLGQRSTLMTDPINGFTGVMNVEQGVQTVKLGVSFHMWAGQ